MQVPFNTIVVSGKSNVGKTTSLKMFVEMAIKLDGAKLESPIPDKYDYFFRFSLMNKVIDVITSGDKKDHIIKAFKSLGKCDYYVCASHLCGDTVNAITDLDCTINPLFLNKIGVKKNLNISENRLNSDNVVFSNQLLQLFKIMLDY